MITKASMAKKEIFDTKKVAEVTSEILLMMVAQSDMNLKEVVKKMPYSYTHVWNSLNGGK